jgi:2-polyprenyl-3-methyl-5-hydroxy-6-metoxy-1,4-benzoquinol methylase
MSITNQTNIDAFASYSREEIEAFGDDGDFGRQHLLNPHLLRLLGDVAGKRVLDAGCGTGYLSRKLARLGADVTGLEPSSTFYSYCMERETQEPLGISYMQEDLSVWKPNDSHDVVVCNQVLMDIVDVDAAIAACIAALKQGGQLLVTLQHPCFENPASEFDEQGHIRIAEYLGEYVIPQTYGVKIHRPLSSYLNTIASHGCRLREMVEPQLEYPYLALKDAHIPSFLIIDFRATPGGFNQ